MLVCKPDNLAAVVGAAHILQETSHLVAADSINCISKRLEGVLEKHYSSQSCPTLVEYEAMQLAVEWLSQLIDALRDNQPEPKSLVEEALLALDLAENFPGKTRLVDLLDSNADQPFPHLDDPFASDPDLGVDADGLPPAVEDPFAEDPGYGLGMNIHFAENQTDSDKASLIVDDPFADDDGLDPSLSLMDVAGVELSGLEEPIPYDPFADDAVYLQEFDSTVMNAAQGVTENNILPAFFPEDPFAEDPPVGDDI